MRGFGRIRAVTVWEQIALVHGSPIAFIHAMETLRMSFLKPWPIGKLGHRDVPPPENLHDTEQPPTFQSVRNRFDPSRIGFGIAECAHPTDTTRADDQQGQAHNSTKQEGKE
jgi:hypothetical protein